MHGVQWAAAEADFHSVGAKQVNGWRQTAQKELTDEKAVHCVLACGLCTGALAHRSVLRVSEVNDVSS